MPQDNAIPELVLSVLLAAVNNAGNIERMVTAGRAEQWTPEQWDAELDRLAAADDLAAKMLREAIAHARAGTA